VVCIRDDRFIVAVLCYACYVCTQKAVPKLLEQNRQPVAHGRAIVDSKDQFLANWETFTKGMFKGLNWNNIFIAGGAVLGTHNSQSARNRASSS
jgi:hypothetical protein